MTSQTPDMDAVLQRLEKLEKQYRKLKQVGLLAVLAVSALMLMAQTPPKSHSVEAEEFILTDAHGKQRVRIWADDRHESVDFYGLTEKRQLRLISGTDGTTFFMSDGDGYVRAILSVGADSSTLSLNSQAGASSTLMLAGEEALLALKDKEGFKTALATTSPGSPTTGEAHQTSGASLTMFDRDGKVIWRAP